MIQIAAVRKEAQRVLKEAGIKEPPVRLKELTEFYVFHVEWMDWPDKYAGRLDRHERKIRVNRHHSKEKQRFTIAHEFGHYFIHRDTGIFVDDENSNPEDEREKEANKFAAELLMPTAWVKRDYGATPDPKALANKYKVSEQAMWIRLLELRLVK